MNTAEVSKHLDELIPAHEIPDDTMELVPVKNGVKKFAAENAYLLIFLTTMFAISWGVTLIVNATS